MWQRPQTVYLGLAFVCLVLILVFPIFLIESSYGDMSLTAEFGAYGLVGEPDSVEAPLYMIVIAFALLTLGSILLFKKRPRQLLFTRLTLILYFIVVIAMYLVYYLAPGMIEENVQAEVGQRVTAVIKMKTGFYLMIPPIAFYIMAIRGIKRDENLVKSLDRLR